MTSLVIGVGSPDGGDDAVGLVVAEQVRLAAPAGLQVLTTTAPTQLLELWQDDDEVVLVDAVRAGDPAGTVTVQRLDTTPVQGREGSRGTHGFGLRDAVELARALDRLPRRLVLVGVEAADFAPAARLSAEVAASVQDAVQAVLEACRPGPAPRHHEVPHH